ncbi:hypothetical protein Cgig2_013434 [Carnegiea gigantea]|uniref:Uncharacterized protein n=1 Tax=Carnegiea gigantea TaxID=171969 RepID=A0A9Q1QD34_9CARY|nr:hypothetical protein Cgig2_013434 [Carnegiea gigantea]
MRRKRRLAKEKHNRGKEECRVEHAQKFPKNAAQESSEKTITDIHRQLSEETDDIVEDMTYKMPPHGHKDESDSEEEVLVKRIKKIERASKPRPKQIQMRSKKCARQKLKKRGRLSRKIQKVLQSVDNSQFYNMINKRNPRNSKQILPFVFKILDSFDPYSVALHISSDKKIEIRPMDLHLTLAHPIGGRKDVEPCSISSSSSYALGIGTKYLVYYPELIMASEEQVARNPPGSSKARFQTAFGHTNVEN